jgi:uncharacterized protein
MSMQVTNRQSIMNRLDPRDRLEIERIIAPLRRRRAGRLVLFGSRARDDARRTSDIDLAFTSPQPVPLDELALIREAFEESRIPFHVDLLDYATAPAQLRAVIDKEGIAWPM